LRRETFPAVRKELEVGVADGMGGTGSFAQRRPLKPELIFCGRSGPGGRLERSATLRLKILNFRPIKKYEFPEIL
jgi:hypothetical protein